MRVFHHPSATMVWTLLALASVVLPSGGAPASSASPGQKLDVRTEGGVTVVRNPKVPSPRPGGPSKLVLNEDLVLGKDPAGGADLFAELRSIGVDDRENIWTLDWEDIKVRVFDKAGKLVSAFGKKGQGPREWQMPSRMVVRPDGTGVILDVAKLTFYSLDGTCLKELPMAQVRLFRAKPDSRGYVYGDQLEAGSEETLRYKLVKCDPSMTKVLATLAVAEQAFAPGKVDPIARLLLCHVTANDHVFWMSNAKYEVNELDPEGRLVRRVIKDYDPVRLTKADRDRYLADRPENSRSQYVFPDEFPPAYSFVVDDGGGFYIQTYETDAKGGLVYDVFDKDGRCFTRFSLPREEMVFAVKKDKLYTLITENAEGIPLVKRYAMTWK